MSKQKHSQTPIIPWVPGVLKRRRRVPEWMDTPGLDPEMHRQALRGLATLNRLSNSSRVFVKPIRKLWEKEKRRLLLVDAGCGRGDLIAGLSSALRGRLEFHGLDISSTATQFAGTRHLPDTRFHVADLLGDWPEAVPPQPDVIISSLVFHHFDEEDLIKILRDWKARNPKLILISDLRRRWLDWWLIWLSARLFTSSPVVHVDSALSVQGAFSRRELRRIFREAGLEGARVYSAFPCRWFVVWKNQGEPLDG
ncbi:MAG: methyltransferase domain-containing protein [Candidatus Sumerlaeia bacterium]|nr:methyltransferase domain-containing protein [Candidatus Sumerlaeia bacterium]